MVSLVNAVKLVAQASNMRSSPSQRVVYAFRFIGTFYACGFTALKAQHSIQPGSWEGVCLSTPFMF
jgi:hypothetical protein